MKRATTTLLTVLVFSLCHAQQYIDVTTETITVNSRTAMSGNTRNTTSVNLPERTIGYIYRLSVFKKGNATVDNSLFQIVQKIDPATALATSLMQLAITNNDGNSVDAFIFNNTYDADNFAAKNDGNWTACRSMLNRSNCCFPTKECLNRKIYFGFRNNNISQGLDVKLEVVAIVDTLRGSPNSYSFTVLNSTTVDLKFLVSSDSQNWAEKSLRAGYQNTFTLDQPQLYIKIHTAQSGFVQYKLTPDNRYKIYLNQTTRKWDIGYY